MKRFRNFENISHKENDFIEIEDGSVYKSSSKNVHKRSRIESMQYARKESVSYTHLTLPTKG